MAEVEADLPSAEEGWKEVDEEVRWEDEEVEEGEVRAAEGEVRAAEEAEESPLLSLSRSLPLVSCHLVALHLVPSLLPLCQC